MSCFACQALTLSLLSLLQAPLYVKNSLQVILLNCWRNNIEERGVAEREREREREREESLLGH